jgi:cytosolic phospholipase A2
MSNNIPFYPLLRRNVDIIIAVDTSADIQTTPWFERTDGYAKQKGIIGWPIGAGWPKDTSPAENIESLVTASAQSPSDAISKLQSAKDDPSPDTPSDPITQKYGLGHCNIWIGNTAERSTGDEPPPPKKMPLDDETWGMDPEDGIILVYMPLLPNDRVPGVVPEETEWMSTWNFQYTPEQIDKVVELAERNFEVGSERVRRAVRAMWIRKRDLRIKREMEEKMMEVSTTLMSQCL